MLLPLWVDWSRPEAVAVCTHDNDGLRRDLVLSLDIFSRRCLPFGDSLVADDLALGDSVLEGSLVGGVGHGPECPRCLPDIYVPGVIGRAISWVFG